MLGKSGALRVPLEELLRCGLGRLLDEQWAAAETTYRADFSVLLRAPGEGIVSRKRRPQSRKRRHQSRKEGKASLRPRRVSEAPGDPPRPDGRARLVAGLLILLVAAVVAVYANALDAPFVLDDVEIKRSPVHKPPVLLAELLSSSRPVVASSLAINYALGELRVTGYHVLNLLAHLTAGLIFFGFARYTLLLPVFRGRYRAAADYLALCATALFLLHPIQTESVTYTIQRAEIFVSLALIAALWVAAAAVRGAPLLRTLPLLIVVGLFGTLSKQAFPIVLPLFALYDWCFLAEGRPRSIQARWPLYCVLGVISVAGLLRVSTTVSAPMVGIEVEGLSRWQYLVWQFPVLLYYGRLILIPNHLCFDCGLSAPWPVLGSPLGHWIWPSVLALSAVAAGAWVGRKRYPMLTFAVWGSAVVLAPTSSIIPLSDVYVEHRLYLTIGLLALLASTAVFDLSQTAVRRNWVTETSTRAARMGGVAVVCGALAWLTIARNHVYSDSLRLWHDTVSKAPQNYRAQYRLGERYRTTGQWEKAIEHYEEARRLGMKLSGMLVHLGHSYEKIGEHGEALSAYRGALELAPKSALVHRNIAGAYLDVGRPAEALTMAKRAIALAPESFRAHMLLGRSYERLGRTLEAMQAYRRASGINPKDEFARQRLPDLAAEAGSSR